MQASKVLLVTFMSLIAFECVQAQRFKKVAKSRYHFSTPKIRGNKAKIIYPTFDKSKYPFHGLGFKLGDPFALTYKYYPNKRFSFAADLGKSASGLYNRYFREKFNLYVLEDEPYSGDQKPVYLSHLVITYLFCVLICIR